MEHSAETIHAPHDDAYSPVEQAGAAIHSALRVIQSAWVLLLAEIRLARSSALMLMWLAFALVFLGVGAWLATSAALAAGIYRLTGSLFIGIAGVAFANLAGAAAVLWAMRRCWRDLALPRTRRLMADTRTAAP